jgi:carboxyl-terminal processing protease
MKFFSSRKFFVIVVAAVIIGFSFGTWAKDKFGGDNILYDLEVFAKVIERVQTNYVDDVNTHALIRDAIDAVLKDLDPHSQFLTGLDYEDLMVSTRGEFGGLGILISFRDHYPTVISPIEGTPAYKVGIQGGDQIVEIEGQSAYDWGVERAVGLLRGEPGTKVTFKISRPGLSEPIEYELTREIITVKSVPYSGMIDSYGYIKVSNFAQQTRDEVSDALKELEKQNIKGLVIDLRANPGGLLKAATEVSELFLQKDKLIVYTKGRLANSNQKYYSTDSHPHGGYPIVVLVNGASASASEIFAGALQDWDAGFIIGQPTFGKGTVQTVFSLSDTEAVKLTTAKYYTPSGRCINIDDHQGLQEEVEPEVTGDATTGEDVGSAASSETEKSKADMSKRPIYNTASGRVVYGGGGITPDVELKPRSFTELQRRLERDALFFSFAVDYSTKHTISKDFTVTNDVIKNFEDFMNTREFKYKPEDLTEENLNYFKIAILREIINKNFGREEMYRRLLQDDTELQKAIQLMQQSKTLDGLFSYAEEHQGLKKASLK